MSERILALMGPTASGKSSLAERLAERFDGELISVDSALVYRGLSIGAAKPDYPHHLVHLRDPVDSYTAADFARDAKRCMEEIIARGRRPILVGGSMLYFRALIHGLDDIPSIDPAIRTAIENEAREVGWPALHRELATVDPASAAQLHPNHSQRICRALEVYRGTGVPLSAWQRGEAISQADQFECIALCTEPRAALHHRIERRLDGMFAEGLIDEVRALMARGDCHGDLPAIRAVGYRQVWAYLQGEFDLPTCREKALVATRQLAKRQLTWLRSWPDLTWIITDDVGRLIQVDKTAIEPLKTDENNEIAAVEPVWADRIESLMRNF